MGGAVGRSLSSKADEDKVPAANVKQPWMLTSGKTTTLFPGDKVDDTMIQVFYEFAVDKAKMRSDIACSTSSKRINSNKQKRTSRRRETTASVMSAFKEHFMTPDHLVAMAQDLGFADLGDHEVSRIFDNMPKNDGKVGREQFASAVKAGPDSGPLQMLVLKFKADASNGFATPEDYDYTQPTSEMYKMDGHDFTEDFERFRRGLDYSYHNNYTIERQRWQDGLIKSTVVRSFSQPSPWLVFTCGPMGVGKGYCMNWMSMRGFFPLENIVHVDPDAFKLMMPEWPKYVEKGGETAGTMCHQESSMMMEISQWAAMDLNQNIWIDGSLRNAEFYAKVFEDIRHRYPHYKISIMYVYADEAVIRERIKTRAERTGRDIPEHLIAASLGAMDKALNTLTPLCDFVARIDNSGTVPVLSAFETIDTRCNWTVVKDRFARKYDGAGEFPDFLAPVPLIPLLPEDVTHLSRPAGEAAHTLKIIFSRQTAENSLSVDGALTGGSRHSTVKGQTKHAIYAVMQLLKKQALGTDGLALDTSTTAQLTLPLQTRELAGVPEKATQYFWVFPVERLGADEMPFQDKFAPFTQLIRNGGFCWCDADHVIIGATAISSKREARFLQFDYPVTVKNDVVAKIRQKRRLRPVSTPCYTQRGAIEFGWMMPNESFTVNKTLHNVGGEFGAFVYTIGEKRNRGEVKAHRFPVMAA